MSARGRTELTRRPPSAGGSTEESFRTLRRRALTFSGLGILLCLVLVAAFEPSGWSPDRVSAFELLARAETGGARFDWSHVPELVAVGAAAGVLAGLLGMGGGVLKVAGLLVVFELDILLARAVSLTTMFLATASAARVHIREGSVLWQAVKPMLGPAVVSMIAGMFLGIAVPRATLTHFFAFFALFLGFNTLAQTFADPNEHAFEEDYPERLDGRRRLACSSIGALHGFVCGLLGISGGVIAMPSQQVFARIPARRAVANSVVVSAVCTSVGSLAAVVTGVLRDDFELIDVTVASSCIGAGAVVGAQLGARLTGIVPVFVLRLLFVQVSFAAGLMVLFR